MIETSNMSHAECFKLNGDLSLERIEQLIDNQLKEDTLPSVECKIEEAVGQFPNEDFLQDIINDIGDIAKRLRGDNKKEMMDIMDRLDEIQMSTLHSSEYGMQELEDALNIIREV